MIHSLAVAFLLTAALLGFVTSAAAQQGSGQQQPPETQESGTDSDKEVDPSTKTIPTVLGYVHPANLDEMAKQLSNPISSLISVPFQYTYSSKYNDDGYKNLLNIQPVIPFSVSENWTLISRTILPVIQQKDVQPGKSQFGLGDTVQSLWMSPKKPTKSGWIWGLGVAGLLPTGTDGIGAKTYAFGPTAVVLRQSGSWTYGFLWNQLWDTGGRADISQMFFQPFLAKSLGKGRTLSLNAESSYNFKIEEWTFPINLSYSKVSKWGGQMVSNQIGAG